MRTRRQITIALGSVFAYASLLYAQPSVMPQGILLAQYPDIVGIAASYNEDDGFRTVIVARQNGEVRELFYKTANGKLTTGVGNSVVASISGVSAVSSFYARDDKFRIVLAATGDGKLHEVFYHPTNGKGESVIGQYSSIRGLAGFYDPATRNRIAIVLTGVPESQIKELAYHPTTGKIEKVLGGASTQAVAMCASYYAGGAGANRRIVTFTPEGKFFETFVTDTPFVSTLKATGGQDGVGDTRSVACGPSGYLFADKGGVSGGWLRVSIPANGGDGSYAADKQTPIMKIAVDSFDSTHAIVVTSDGRVLLFVKP